jgi:hypothetical protein
MSAVEDIKKAASALSVTEREELLSWLLMSMTIGTAKWPEMRLLANLIFLSKKGAPLSGKNRCAIGRNQTLDLEEYSYRTANGPLHACPTSIECISLVRERDRVDRAV